MHKHQIRTRQCLNLRKLRTAGWDRLNKRVEKLFSFIKCTHKVVLSCFTTNTLHCLPMMQEPLPITKGVIVFIKPFATVGYFPSIVPSSPTFVLQTSTRSLSFLLCPAILQLLLGKQYPSFQRVLQQAEQRLKQLSVLFPGTPFIMKYTVDCIHPTKSFGRKVNSPLQPVSM